MRCIAATRHGNRFADTESHGNGLNSVMLTKLQAIWDFSVIFRVGQRPLPCPLEAAAMQRIARAWDGGGHACIGRRNAKPEGRQRRRAATAASVVACKRICSLTALDTECDTHPLHFTLFQ